MAESLEIGQGGQEGAVVFVKAVMVAKRSQSDDADGD